MTVLPIRGPREEAVAELNEQYALILHGDRPAVLPLSDTGELRFLSVSGFHEWLRPKVFFEGKMRVQASKAWIDSANRRQYDGIVFDPSESSADSVYNLWRGFAVEPSASGSCKRFIAHVSDVVCDGDEPLFNWVMGWFAALIQEPTKKLGTSIALRGGQGTGKSIVGNVVGKLLGRHYSAPSDKRYVIGRFNSVLASCLLLQLEEAIWGGDHEAAGKVKDLITSDWQFIEWKGREPVRVRNYVRLFATSNNEWMIPAGIDERRFCAIDVSDKHKQDITYFRAMLAELEMKDGAGYGALLQYLVDFDYRDIPLRQVPRTAALVEQQIASLMPHQAWWVDILRAGVLPGDRDGRGETDSKALYDHYVRYVSDKMGVTRRMNEMAFGHAIHRMAPGVLRNRRAMATPGGVVRRYVYEFPSLPLCRTAFERLLGEIDLSGDAEQWASDRSGSSDQGGLL